MTRGTTVTLNFTLPFDVSTITACNITFGQARKILFERTLEQCSLTSTYVLSLPLSQVETLLFDARTPLFVQLRLKVGETAMASQIFNLDVRDILKEGVI